MPGDSGGLVPFLSGYRAGPQKKKKKGNSLVRNLGRGIAALLALALVATAGPALGQIDPTIAIGTIGGQAVGSDGRLAAPVNAADLTVTGVSDLGEVDTEPDPGLIADAGDSVFVERGKPVTLVGLAHGGEGPFTFGWSVGGSSAGFADPAVESPTLDTTGLPLGPVTVDLSVTDGTGASDTDTVQLFLYELAEQDLIDTSQEVSEGVPDELIDGGGIDGQSKSFPFSILPGSQDLRLELSWGSYTSVDDPDGAPQAGVNDFDLYVDDPSDEHDESIEGAGASMPEVIEIEAPSVGDWQARVDAYLNRPDTYRLKVSAVSPPNNPLPRLTTAGPFRFESNQPQALTASVAGGTTPHAIAWDLNLDGNFESAGANVTAALPLGNHLVTAKVTDAAGFEHRETTAVRVVEPGSGEGNSAVVVVGVSDTGINPYHRDFSAATYPNADVLALTDNFTRHPSEYIPGYPADMPALPITLGEGYRPAGDAPLFTKANLPLGKDVWIPRTKIVGAVDTSDVQPINGAPDTIPLLDEDGHGTASASVAVGNVFGFCPSCLLVFGEGFSSDAYMYEQDWIDITSNSFGTAGNIGFAGLAAASQPEANANAGQLALYAAGNGNENAFVTPQQTYTAENLGADWLIRVGAVVRSSRKPIVGTGKPVDVSSFGSGTIPAAGINTVEGTTNHSGTSAATPYTSGVFGDVLRRVRGVLGDSDTGARGQGVLATGTPSGTAHLADGVLTRAELEEAVLKTTQHDTSGTTSVYPTTTPNNPAQYVIEGYGIAEPASGERAFQVLMGEQPVPLRPDEDEFFAADSMLRDALWGSWNKGGANSAGGQQAAAPAVNPFAGITTAAITDLDSALALLDGAFDLWPEPAANVGDPTAVGGAQTYWLHHTGPCDGSAADNVFMDYENSSGDNDGCGAIGTTSVVGSDVEQWTSTVVNGASIPAGTAVTGSLFFQTAEPNSVTLTATLNSNTGVPAGSGTSDPVLTAGLADAAIPLWNEAPFAFTTTRTIAAGETLTLSAALNTSASWFFGYEGDHASNFTIASGGGEVDPGGLAATIDAPTEGTVVDPDLTPTLTASGSYSFGEAAPAAAAATATTRHYPRRDDCGGDADNPRLTRVDGGDGGNLCGPVPGASVIAAVTELRHNFPLVSGEVPVTLAAGTVSGTVYVVAEGPSPQGQLRMELTTLDGAVPTTIGSQSVPFTTVGFPVEEFVALPFSFSVGPANAGRPLDDLTFSVLWEQGQGGVYLSLEGDGSTSYVDLPLAGEITPPDEGTVEVSLDNFATVSPAVLSPEGTWSLDIPTAPLADGAHTISVRARSATGETSAPDAVGIVVDRVDTVPTEPTVQVQYVPAGTAPSLDGWVTATDTSATGDFSSWSHTFVGFGGNKKGNYELHARLIDGSSVLASTVSRFCNRGCKDRIKA